MDNEVYGHWENRGCLEDKDVGFPQAMGTEWGMERRVIHRAAELRDFIHIPRFGKVAERCGFPGVSPLSTPLQLRRHSLFFSFSSDSTEKTESGHKGARFPAESKQFPFDLTNGAPKLPIGTGGNETMRRSRFATRHERSAPWTDTRPSFIETTSNPP